MRNNASKWLGLIAFVGISAAGMAQAQPIDLILEQQATNTPLQVQIITSTPLPLVVITPTPTYTPSPDVQSAVLVEAKAAAGEVNARAEPDLEAEIVGKISAGDQYVITGRYFRWIRFRYLDNQDAWVFDELVDILGNEALILDLSQVPQATDDPALVAASETNAVLQLTPGALLSATANSRELVGPVAVGDNGEPSAGTAEVEAPNTTPIPLLPTFTYPPQIAQIATDNPNALAATPFPVLNRSVPATGFPPIIPIILLAGFGLLGLIVNAIRSR
jgi:hypothetical protein